MGDFPPEQVNQYYQELTKALLKADPKTNLSLANAIWANKNITLKNNFVSLNKEYYDAEVGSFDFLQASTLKTINDWCYKKTKGTIPQIVDKIEPTTVIILANAIYFKSIWTDKFDKSNTKDKPFRNIDGSSSTVPRMHQKPLKLLYAQMDNCGMATLPYSNGAFAMNLILPEEGQGIDVLISDLDGALWQIMTAHREVATVTLSMPRFKVESKLEKLQDILATLGMPLAFSPNNADFSAMSDVQVYISDMLQKSYISVDETGTEAAAVTVGKGNPTAIRDPKEVTMVLDRPFLFIITEQSTGAILFMGKVVKM
jgi:serpin B